MTTNEKVLWFIIALLFSIIIAIGFAAINEMSHNSGFDRFQIKKHIGKHKKPPHPRFLR